MFKNIYVKLGEGGTQSSSQSCTMEMKEPVVMSLKTWVNCDLGESLFDIFKVACKSVFMTFPLAT